MCSICQCDRAAPIIPVGGQAMEHSVGIDVSLELSSVCLIDATGKIVVEAKIESHPDAIVALLRKLGLSIERAGLEAGPLSQWLHSGLSKGGFETVLLETRHVKAALSAHAPGSAVSSSRPTLLAHPSAGRANWARWPLSGLRTNPSPVKRGAACADSRSPSPRISVPWVSPQF